MAEAIAVAAKAFMKKLAVDLALDKDKRNKFLLIVGSIVVGLIFLLMTPVVVLSSIGGIEPPTVEFDFKESDFLNNMDDKIREKLENIQAQGQAIEDAMIDANIGDQTIKAQLIYLSFFEKVPNFDVQNYVNLFRDNPEDSALIRAINFKYPIETSLFSDFFSPQPVSVPSKLSAAAPAIIDFFMRFTISFPLRQHRTIFVRCCLMILLLYTYFAQLSNMYYL